MINIKSLNSQILHYLEDLSHYKGNDLRYTLRKSNYGGRLEEGYWFYGNDNYLSVSFWSGMDWKNRTPNISFTITSEGRAKLEINVSDSDDKRRFVDEYLYKSIAGLNPEGRRYVKYYDIDMLNPVNSLNMFIYGNNHDLSDKGIIDQIIYNHYGYLSNDNDNQLGFIDEYDFERRIYNVHRYQQLQNAYSDEINDIHSKPFKIASVSIKGYQSIRNASVSNIAKSTQWIFVTGENGSGKTSVLKAIAAGLGFKVIEHKEIDDNPGFEIDFNLYKGKDVIKYNRINNDGCHQRLPLVSALVTFGPNRLASSKDSKTRKNFSATLKKQSIFNSLWAYDYKMLDIEEQFKVWTKSELQSRIYYIRTILSKVVPGLYDIRFNENTPNSSQQTKAKYIIRKDESSVEEEKSWDQLSSGTRSSFAMISEMLIRLYHFQKDIVDPAELRGIVIIDEIDLHLHPNAQRQLIIDLTNEFRSVQFIVSTHSPIPLLGAPKGSVFIRVYKDSKGKVIMERLNDIEENISNLLPNIIYTSSVFGMHDMISVANTNKEDILTQDNAREAENYLDLKNELNVSSPDNASFIAKMKERLKK
jgi:predicted ATP-binding protein involved in virulence